MSVQTLQKSLMVLPDLKDKVALITGAGSGIGRAAAILLAQQGMNLCLVDLKDDRLEQTKKEIELAGGKAITVDIDISDPNSVEQAFEQAAKTLGRINFVFANAGINGVLAPIENLNSEDWDRTLNVNLKGTFLCVKHAIPHMKEKGGSIVITSSINGSRTFSGFGMTAYSASKAAQIAFAKMAALELAQYKIRVNAICPGSIKTNIGENTQPTPELDKIKIPIKYPEGSQPLEHAPGQPEQVANLVAFLASDASNHITGTELFIDGAESLL
ncbi:SDR family oxidoreductase [Paenibacillus roseipurpureus]|uniref:SDR family NAD(P)-dependent oxidoreductase n=1 Tax=Paenibacillus roseopurpureus TaxID=2918901 RepID=A0AA96LVG8_9BACL|nr:SDR family NAD(P)-dependent oxidoreductase [Paenibacillus sp. MBLB1832]WNR46809.1 SDR family NAD(P)-dependent oxidoreductase [Paenibacillus sp. MBLB1832]